MIPLTVAEIKKWDNKVARDPKYGKEQDIIEKVIKLYPYNTELLPIAMKVSVIDLTNSTQLTNYKSKISLYDICQVILGIEHFDERLASGDPELVIEIARRSKNVGGIDKGVNLFSFASKYCCYHNIYQYKRDDYSIFDNVVSDVLYLYSTKKNPLKKTQPEKWRQNIQYKEYNDYIGSLLDEKGITSSVTGRRRMFDHFLWYTNK